MHLGGVPWVMVLSVVVAISSVGVIRMMPDPERTMNLGGEYFGLDDTGELSKFKMIKSAQDTNNEYIEFEELQTVTCGNGFESKCSPPYHIHLHQEEVFTVLEGDFMYMLEGEVGYAKVGDSVRIAPGLKHRFARAPNSTSTLRINFKLFPGDMATENFFATFAGVMRDTKQKPSPVQMIWLFCESGTRLADIPGPIHDGLCMLTGLFGPLLGYQLAYDVYRLK